MVSVYLSRFGSGKDRALPTGESANSWEYSRLWRVDLRGDIREAGGSLAASLLLTRATLGGREALSRRHSRRVGLLDRVSEPLLSATYDLSEPYRY